MNQAFKITNPSELYDPRSNGYSHIAVVPPNQRIIHIAGQHTDIAVLRILIVDHNCEKHQTLIQIMQSLWKHHAFPVCTLIPVSRLALDGMLIEIEATAYTA